ncbi:MAG: hypothetical protein HY329_13990 [Chloroflexi bacterium]|nr:hypothetical protein [Chloroflexota bacterium]
MSADLCFLSAHELGRRYRTRDLSPVEVADAHLRRIEALNARLNAFVTVTADLALEQARAAERQLVAGDSGNPLLGVPYSLKDLYATAGIRTTAGSKILSDWVPDFDSASYEQLRAAGAVLLGKTNTHEYAAGGTTNNPWYGQTYNPWHPERIPGGSSGGAGSAVAAGLGPIGMGSDTAGSIRLPASFCGVVGLKPTYGRASAYGVTPLAWSLDHVGPLTRTVTDAALTLAALAGHDPRDPSSALAETDDYLSDLERGVRGLRIGVPNHYFFDLLDPEYERSVRSAIAQLEQLGAELHDVEVPGVDEGHAAADVLIFAEASEYHRNNFQKWPASFGADLQDRILVGGLLGAVDYARAQRVRSRLREYVSRLFDPIDVLVTPTTTRGAPPLNVGRTVMVGDREVPLRTALTKYSRFFNVTGQPAISIPCGIDGDGLPIGLQLVGRPFGEATILRAARALEPIINWAAHQPPLD